MKYLYMKYKKELESEISILFDVEVSNGKPGFFASEVAQMYIALTWVNRKLGYRGN